VRPENENGERNMLKMCGRETEINTPIAAGKPSANKASFSELENSRRA
jgi:hypothetical protein